MNNNNNVQLEPQNVQVQNPTQSMEDIREKNNKSFNESIFIIITYSIYTMILIFSIIGMVSTKDSPALVFVTSDGIKLKFGWEKYSLDNYEGDVAEFSDLVSDAGKFFVSMMVFSFIITLGMLGIQVKKLSKGKMFYYIYNSVISLFIFLGFLVYTVVFAIKFEEKVDDKNGVNWGLESGLIIQIFNFILVGFAQAMVYFT